MYTLFCYCFHNICYTWTGLLFACFCSLLPKKAEVTRTCKSLVANSKGNLQRKRIAYWAMEKNVINCCYEINSLYISTIKIFVILCQRVCISVVRPRVCMLLLVSVKQVTNFMVAVKEPVVVFETKDGGFLFGNYLFFHYDRKSSTPYMSVEMRSGLYPHSLTLFRMVSADSGPINTDRFLNIWYT